jgi:hypothetical protein
MVVSEVRLRFDAMFRAFRFSMDGGADWSVVDDGTYETITSADRFLQYMRFGRGRADSTTRKYAEAIALYFSYLREPRHGLDRTRHHRFPDVAAIVDEHWGCASAGFCSIVVAGHPRSAAAVVAVDSDQRRHHRSRSSCTNGSGKRKAAVWGCEFPGNP